MPFANMNGVNAARGMQGTQRDESATFNQAPPQQGAAMGMQAQMPAQQQPMDGYSPQYQHGGVNSFGRVPVGSSYNKASGMMTGGQQGMAGSTTQNQNSTVMPNGHGVTPGITGGPAMNLPPQASSLESIQQEMARRQVGAQLNANPQNSALSGYMMA